MYGSVQSYCNWDFKAFKQGVQGLQAFAFCVLTVDNEHTKQT